MKKEQEGVRDLSIWTTCANHKKQSESNRAHQGFRR